MVEFSDLMLLFFWYSFIFLAFIVKIVKPLFLLRNNLLQMINFFSQMISFFFNFGFFLLFLLLYLFIESFLLFLELLIKLFNFSLCIFKFLLIVTHFFFWLSSNFGNLFLFEIDYISHLPNFLLIKSFFIFLLAQLC